MSAAPRFVHVPVPAGEVWNCTDATPEPVSAEFDVTVTVPLTAAPLAGAVIDPVGGMASTVTEALVPLTAVQEWKTAVTLHTNVPSPGASEQAERGDARRRAGAARGTPGHPRGRAALGVVLDDSCSGRRRSAPAQRRVRARHRDRGGARRAKGACCRRGAAGATGRPRSERGQRGQAETEDDAHEHEDATSRRAHVMDASGRGLRLGLFASLSGYGFAV